MKQTFKVAVVVLVLLLGMAGLAAAADVCVSGGHRRTRATDCVSSGRAMSYDRLGQR